MRKRPTSSVDSSSDSDTRPKPSPSKKVKGGLPLDEEKEGSEEEGPFLATRRRRRREVRKDPDLLITSPQSPAIELDEEEESGEVADVNANGYIEDEDVEAQYVKLFSRATFLTNLLRFRRSVDTQLCEQLEDGMWKRAAKFFRISGVV